MFILFGGRKWSGLRLMAWHLRVSVKISPFGIVAEPPLRLLMQLLFALSKIVAELLVLLVMVVHSVRAGAGLKQFYSLSSSGISSIISLFKAAKSWQLLCSPCCACVSSSCSSAAASSPSSSILRKHCTGVVDGNQRLRGRRCSRCNGCVRLTCDV